MLAAGIMLMGAGCATSTNTQSSLPPANPDANSFAVSQEPVNRPAPAAPASPVPVTPVASNPAVTTSPEAAPVNPSAVATPPAPEVINKTLINIQNFAFDPAEITVPVGSTVIWTNNDPVPHQITSDSFSSPTLDQGSTFSQKFTAAGTYAYHCSIHPSMVGKIIVQ